MILQVIVNKGIKGKSIEIDGVARNEHGIGDKEGNSLNVSSRSCSSKNLLEEGVETGSRDGQLVR